jgi:hypothetical protein
MDIRVMRPVALAAGVLASAVVLLAPPAPAEASIQCRNFENHASFGHAVGTLCGNHAHGWVTDDKADGYCVFVRAHYAGGFADGPWACPKNVTKEFHIYTPSDIQSTSIEKLKVT